MLPAQRQRLIFPQYEQEDGTILGDPMNASLTKEMINLGWRPPTLRTRSRFHDPFHLRLAVVVRLRRNGLLGRPASG